MHCLACVFALTLLVCHLSYIAHSQNLASRQFVDSNGKPLQASSLTLLLYFITSYPDEIRVMVGTAMIGIVLAAFFLYHMWLVAVDRTTNEQFRRNKRE